MKIGYIVDSSCGLSKEEAEKRGWLYLSIKLTIDGKEYNDGVDLTTEEFYQKINIENVCKTAATSPGETISIFDKATKQFDEVIVYGLSTELSSQTENLMHTAKEYKNIRVISSKGVGNAIVKDLEEVANINDPDVVFDKLSQLTKQQWGLAFPRILKWLVRGGRISPAIANMANLLKIIPIIKFENGALDKYGKGRVFSKTILKSAAAIKKDHPDKDYIIYRGTYDGIEKDILEIKKVIGECPVYYMPPVIASHTCPEVIAIMARHKISADK